MGEINLTLKCLSILQARKYVQGEIAAEERFQLEDHLVDCHFCTALVNTIQTNELDIIKEETYLLNNSIRMDAFQQALEQQQFVPDRRMSILITAAGCALLLLLIVVFFRKEEHPKNLYKLNFTPYESVEWNDLRNTDLENIAREDSRLATAMRLTVQKDYEGALKNWNSYLVTHESDERALFWSGLCYLESEQTKEAIRALTRVRLKESRYYEPATWYLALAHIKNEEWTLAKLLLKELWESDSHAYAQRSEELINQLTRYDRI